MTLRDETVRAGATSGSLAQWDPPRLTRLGADESTNLCAGEDDGETMPTPGCICDCGTPTCSCS